MARFFTSDHHFGHAGARGLFRRPFGSVAEMDQAMAVRWNEVVGAKDEVWHLGDFAVRQGYVAPTVEGAHFHADLKPEALAR